MPFILAVFCAAFGVILVAACAGAQEEAPQPEASAAAATGSISGSVFYDANQDGARDSCDGGIASVSVTLAAKGTPSADLPFYTTDSDADGQFRFSGVEPAEYVLVLGPVPPDAARGPWEFTVPHTVSDDQARYEFSLRQGESRSDFQFGAKRPSKPVAVSDEGSSVSGFVFEDKDGDGTVDADECGIPGVSVAILGGPWAETGGDGAYTFTGVPAATVTLQMIRDYGVAYDPNAGFWRAAQPPANPQCEILLSVVTSGDNLTDVNFGLQRLQGTGRISGYIFHDRDRDGLRDPEEPGVGSRHWVDLMAEQASCWQPGMWRAWVAPDGSFTFEEVPAGSWSVYTPWLFGLGSSKPVVSTTGTTAAVALAEGESATVDFGFREAEPAYVIVRVINDLDGDGVLEAGEPGLAGWEVCSWLTDAVGGCSATDESGTLTFGPMPQGSLSVEVPEGWILTNRAERWQELAVSEGETKTLEFGLYHP